MDIPQIDISFITLNYNGLPDTIELIESLIAHIKSVTYEIIVVDNASKDQKALSFFSQNPLIKLILSPVNLGFAGGNNLGIKAAKGCFLFFINNDTYIQEDHFAELISGYNNSIGILCPKLRFAQPPYLIQYAGFTDLSCITLRNKAIGYGEPDKGQYDKPCTTYFAHGAAMLVSRDALKYVGPMNEDYFLYYEELDWSSRFRQAGYTIGYNPVQTIFHKESQSTGSTSPLKTYYLTRNRLKYASKFRQGCAKCLSLAYLLCVVSIRDIIKHTINRRFDLAKATLRAIRDFACNR